MTVQPFTNMELDLKSDETSRKGTKELEIKGIYA